MPISPRTFKIKTKSNKVHLDNSSKGRGGRAWMAIRKSVLMRDRYLCVCESCKRDGSIKTAHEVDHIIPLSLGGTDDYSNLQSINKKCHVVKTTKEMRERIKIKKNFK